MDELEVMAEGRICQNLPDLILKELRIGIPLSEISVAMPTVEERADSAIWISTTVRNDCWLTVRDDGTRLKLPMEAGESGGVSRFQLGLICSKFCISFCCVVLYNSILYIFLFLWQFC